MASSLFPQQIVNRQTGMSQATPQIINTMAAPAQNPSMPAVQNNRDKILKLWNTVKNSSNPQAAFEQMLSTNPELKTTYDMMVSMSNGDFQKLFYTMAQKQGTDPNSILGLL